MQFKTTAAAIAAALSCETAFALPPSAVFTEDFIVRVAGSTIHDNYFAEYLKKICVANTIDSYKDNDATGKGTYWKAFSCQLDSTKVSGLGVVNPNFLILKRNRSGAITGVLPLLEPGKPIKFMGLNNNPLVGGSAQPQCTESPAGSRAWLCRTDRLGDLLDVTPDLGVGDVDPYNFSGPNYTPTIDGVTFAEPNLATVSKILNVVNSGGIIQNIPVSLGLRNALQDARIHQGKLDADCLNDDSERCMPNLSKGFIASLFLGKIAKWSDVKVSYDTANGAVSEPLTSFGVLPADQKVYLCRRNKGASTQVAFNAYFLDTPCSTWGSIPPESPGNPLNGPVILTPTQVTTTEQCLDDLDRGTNAGGNNPGLTAAWAISMLTTERNASLAYNYRYLKIDGYAPTLEEVAAGHYLYYSGATYHWRKLTPKPTGAKLRMIQVLAANASAPDILGVINGKVDQPWNPGPEGAFIAESVQGYAVSHPFDPANPVTPYTHAPSGKRISSCRIPQVDTRDSVNLVNTSDL